MEEKVIIRNTSYNFKKCFRVIAITFAIICALIIVCMFLAAFFGGMNSFDESYDVYLEHKGQNFPCRRWRYDHMGYCYDCDVVFEYSKVGYAFSNTIDADVWLFSGFVLLAYAGVLLVAGLICLMLRSYELTVTDKRVYGKVKFGRRVDLPIDSISSVGTAWFKSLSLATSSGKVSFAMLKNRDEIHSIVSQLIANRQKQTVNSEMGQSCTDELKKYKELFDSGVITQEEFDAKKKQLLGI